jgi:hypothetical protein
MTERELNIALREMARADGLCDGWYQEWSDDSTVDECLERFVKGQDFAIENDYPPLDFIRKNFDKEALHRHNIYLDEAVEIEADSGYYVFLGKCEAKVRVGKYHVTTVYVRHESNVDVLAYDCAKAFVMYYDQSDGACQQEELGTCRCYDRKKG